MQETKLEGKIIEDKVVIKDERELYDTAWYGNFEEGKLILDFIEACLLCERAKIEVYLNNKKMDFKDFFHFCAERDPRFICKYTVYKDLRERGLPVRIGFKGSDFRVYERGAKPDTKKEIKWIIFAESEDYICKINKVNKLSRLAKNIRALALWAVVDNDLDTTYYIIQHKTEL